MGRGAVGKQIVLGLRERTGKVKATTAQGTDRVEIHKFINDNVRVGATVCTDDHKSYIGLTGYNHESVNHSGGQYVRDNIHTNGIESFWALLKRGYCGTFHHFSPDHALRYVNEFVSRMNNKECDTEDVLAITVMNSTGKLLPYKVLTNDSSSH